MSSASLLLSKEIQGFLIQIYERSCIKNLPLIFLCSSNGGVRANGNFILIQMKLKLEPTREDSRIALKFMEPRRVWMLSHVLVLFKPARYFDVGVHYHQDDSLIPRGFHRESC